MFADCINTAGHRGKCETVSVNSTKFGGQQERSIPVAGYYEVNFETREPNLCSLELYPLFFEDI